jgi:hypothetical protein
VTATTTDHVPDPAPRVTRLVRVLLLLILFGCFYRGYWMYSLMDREGGVGPYLDLVHGVGPAPFQYRVTPVLFANFFYQHFHLPFRYGFSLLDAIASTIAVMLGYELLRRRAIFREAGVAVQCFGSALYVALVLYLLAWQDWYKKNETESAAALVMLLLLAWSPRSAGSWWRGGAGRALTVAGILAAVVGLSTIRADAAMCVSLGMLAVACVRRRGELSLPRVEAVATAAASILLAVGTQAVLMKVIFTHARAYDGPVFMLPYDIWRPNDLLEFLVYLMPAIWTLWQVRKRRFTADAAGVGILLGCIPFVLLWALIGRIEEVRIFLPMGLGVAPLAVEMAMLMVAGLEARAPEPGAV